jgi:hypothetical protein
MFTLAINAILFKLKQLSQYRIKKRIDIYSTLADQYR